MLPTAGTRGEVIHRWARQAGRPALGLGQLSTTFADLFNRFAELLLTAAAPDPGFARAHSGGCRAHSSEGVLDFRVGALAYLN